MTRLPTSATAPIAALVSSGTRSAPLSFIYASHSRWPLPPDQSIAHTRGQAITISVLDSSFNPPHAAHSQLAQIQEQDAQLLAFTVSNADKKLDRSELYHRLEMIRALALDMQERQGVNNKPRNIAVAVMDAPTFVQKSQVLRDEVTKMVREMGDDKAEPEFVFPVGWDTVVRIFAPRYYPPPGPDLSASMETFLETNRSSLVCARRGNIPSSTEQEFLTRPEVDKYVKLGKLVMCDLDRAVQAISSTEIRDAVVADDWDKVHEMIPFPRVVAVIKEHGLYKA
ncbi:nicotinamide-nucleotide adenylyltransferase [Sporobolomyces koalae]|uniref:nicotinamide-nucleotide adenylyltransferase n=1 Tax=Sporobolomyces koalae TaxID=500713 RepID=UPI0031740587